MKRLGILAVIAAIFVLPVATADAQSNTTRTQFGSLNLSNDEPIQIDSQRFEADDTKHVATFIGDVVVVQGETTLKAGRLKIFYQAGNVSATSGGNGQIDRIEVEGGVYVQSASQVATGDRGTFDMATEVLVLSGNEVVLTEGENVIIGCKLSVQMKTGQATLESCKNNQSDGRVRMLLTPNSQNQSTNRN